ncbi:MAG: O-antigen ligase family protein [Bacteroidales bacterium]|nr:O-antigen ligase family protein [Bacteroidales bacterium]
MNWRIIFAFIFITLSLSLAYVGNEFFITSGHYFICFVSGISLFWFCVRLCWNQREIHTSALDMAVLALIAYLAISSIVVSGFPVGYLPFCMLCCCGLSYVVAKQQANLFTFIPMVVFGVLLSGIVQSVWGLLQTFNILSVHAGNFKTSGSFLSSGVYANYLACIFPMALAILLYSKRNVKKISFVISWLFVVCCILAILATMARAAWVGMLIGALVVTEYRYNWLTRIFNCAKKIKSILSMITILIVIGMAGIAMYHLKPESVQGRLLIYKITLGICKDHPWIGVGFNTFAREYNLYQADYFASSAGNEKEEWLAGINQVAFNEYFQITAETGLIGLILLLTIGCTLIYYRKQIRTPYAIGAMGSLIALACSACFSYPFHEISIAVLAGWMLLIIGNDLKPFTLSVPLKVQKYVIACFLLATILLCCYSVTTVSSLSRWKNLTVQTNLHSFDNTIEQYAELYTQLDNNPYFLYNYGIELVRAKEYEQSIPVLQRACRYFSDTDVFCYLGDAYKGLGQFENAEHCYRLASNMTPNKFRPLYSLVKLYSETGDIAKASELASILIEKKEKVKSYTTYKIKKEMRQLIKDIEREAEEIVYPTN